MGWSRERSVLIAAAVLVVLSPLLVGAASATAGEGSATGRVVALAPDWQAHMLARVNTLRAEVGVRPVRLCAPLSVIAQRHAEEMAGTTVFSHAGPAGDQVADRIASVGYRMLTAGENIAAGQATPREAMRAWRESTTHLAVLTNPAFRHVGFGAAVTAVGDFPVYWVQDFASGGSC